jgi:hypothetical protein
MSDLSPVGINVEVALYVWASLFPESKSNRRAAATAAFSGKLQSTLDRAHLSVSLEKPRKRNRRPPRERARLKSAPIAESDPLN